MVLARHPGGVCGCCGLLPAEETHHVAYYAYPADDDVSEGDLTPLCSPCHALATTLRKFMGRFGASPAEIVPLIVSHMGSSEAGSLGADLRAALTGRRVADGRQQSHSDPVSVPESPRRDHGSEPFGDMSERRQEVIAPRRTY